MRTQGGAGGLQGRPSIEAPPQIVARDMVKTYRLGSGVIGALQGVSVEIHHGEYLAVTGASGSGKSTFMNLIGALDTPTRGSLQVEGQELGSLGSDALAQYRNAMVGFVFQTFNLLPRMSALDNVALPSSIHATAIRTRATRPEPALPVSGLPTARRISPLSFPADNSNGWHRCMRSSTIRISFPPTSPPGPSTVTPPMRSSICSRNSRERHHPHHRHTRTRISLGAPAGASPSDGLVVEDSK